LSFSFFFCHPDRSGPVFSCVRNGERRATVPRDLGNTSTIHGNVGTHNTLAVDEFAIIVHSQKEPGMPIYEYICDDCSSQFEKIVINRQQEISCPKCSSKKATIQLSVFSSTTAGGSTKSSGPSNGGSCCGGGCGCH
jgi:putative FmdB family regulatory protein